MRAQDDVLELLFGAAAALDQHGVAVEQVTVALVSDVALSVPWCAQRVHSGAAELQRRALLHVNARQPIDRGHGDPAGDSPLQVQRRGKAIGLRQRGSQRLECLEILAMALTTKSIHIAGAVASQARRQVPVLDTGSRNCQKIMVGFR